MLLRLCWGEFVNAGGESTLMGVDWMGTWCGRVAVTWWLEEDDGGDGGGGGGDDDVGVGVVVVVLGVVPSGFLGTNGCKR